MNLRRVIWLGVSAFAVATWLASASTSNVRLPAVSAPLDPRPDQTARASAALDSEIARLQQRIGPSATPVLARDLFHFNEPARPRREMRAAAGTRESDAAQAIEPAPAPALSLIGIAEDTVDGSVVRTAILSGLGSVFLAKAGDTVAGRFAVDQVSADAVRLTDTASATDAVLALR